MSLSVLYIDAIYPYEWLASKQAELSLDKKDFAAYRNWVLEQRIYLSDYISANLRNNGFICEEIIVNDPMFLRKLDTHLNNRPGKKLNVKKGLFQSLKKLADISPLKLYRSLKPSAYQRIESVVQKAWEVYQPDIIFVREPTGIDTYFWQRFRHRSLVVGLIGCNTSHPYNWLSHNFDVLFSLTEEYDQFFKVQNIPSYIFSYGVEEKVYNQLQNVSGKPYDVAFVGLLGNEVQTRKTDLLEHIASRFNFNWWGPRNVDEHKFPALYRSYQGKTSGIEMLKIYRQSKIVVNDYVDTANSIAVNLRLYEVLNSGSFLLTRYAKNLETAFPTGLIEMYNDEVDCIKKIEYYLRNEEERESRAKNAAKWTMEHASYSDKIKNLGHLLQHEYNKKFKHTDSLLSV